MSNEGVSGKGSICDNDWSKGLPLSHAEPRHADELAVRLESVTGVPNRPMLASRGGLPATFSSG